MSRSTMIRSHAAACVIVKDEVTEIACWILHHLAIGFDEVFVYDNGSTDGTAAILALLGEDDRIHVVGWQPQQLQNADSTQLMGYTDCLLKNRDRFDWIALFDADEYLIPQPGVDLAEFLSRFPSASAVAVNWLMFGSSGKVDAFGSNPLTGYVDRAADDNATHAHVKSIVRPGHVVRVVNAHCCETVGPCVNVRGEQVVWSDQAPGIVRYETMTHGDVRLHHYFTRSAMHWQRRLKRKNFSIQRSAEEFRQNDKREVRDESAVPFGVAVDGLRASLPQAAAIEAIAQAYLASPQAGELRENANRMVVSVASEPSLQADAPASSDAAASPLVFVVDDTDNGRLRGWAAENDSTQDAAFVVEFDARIRIACRCDAYRPDVREVGFQADHTGFLIEMPPTIRDGGKHAVCVFDSLNRRVRISQGNGSSFEMLVATPSEPTVKGFIDPVEQGYFRGWAVQVDDDGQWRGNVQIEVRCNGVLVTTTRSNRPRPDVAHSIGCEVYCGFEAAVPIAFRRSEPQVFEFLAMPGRVSLGDPLTATVLSRPSEVFVSDVADEIESLFKQVAALRVRVRAAKAEERFNLLGYDRWHARYARALSGRLQAVRPPADAKPDRSANPLVSVVMPIYKPCLEHFNAAVESVLRQSYRNWELLLVDDRSMSSGLDQRLAHYDALDARVRLFRMPRNGGISRSTNHGLENATGDWIAFFDHDDLLDEHALEIMVRAARATGAKLLYSDEDKVDDFGYFSDPAFKPGFNPRLLLSYNYINHLTMVAAEVARRAGPLRKAFDGAQDHDFLLRVVEQLPESAIHHVPEVLYHWRKTATSTAMTIETKAYAVKAGARAISEHLARTGRSGKVTSVDGGTHYRIAWTAPRREPKVRIVIPFREQAAVTRRCLDAIRAHTRYPNYEIVLVDNWSASDEAKALVADARLMKDVWVFRVEEDFNYSRLNNLALRDSDAEYFVLMNNDVFVETGDWLDVLLGEVRADPRAVAAAGKYLYPNRTIQHAGVILGQGGVAGHFYAGQGETYPGYLGRARVAQNVSAVTAACMLVKATAYREINGFDEKNLKVAFNDIDLCMRLQERGGRIVWTPEFVAEHHESLSRGSDARPEALARFHDEVQYMQLRWGDRLTQDPAYSAFFSLDGVPFQDLANPEQAERWMTPAPRDLREKAEQILTLQARSYAHPREVAG